SRAGVSLNGCAGKRVVDPVAGANGCLRIQLISEPDARLEIVVIAIHRMAVVVVSETELAYQVRILRNLPGQRRSGFEIEPAIAVVALGARDIKVVTQAQVESQLAADLPIILRVEAVVLGCRSRPGIEMIITAAAPADQHRRDGIALKRAAAVRIFVGDSAIEAEMPLRISRLQIIQPIQPRFRARFKVVTAEALGHASREAVDV